MSARPIGKLGRYTLLREIAQGGMARVFLAVRSGSTEPCVLKQLHGALEDNPTAAKRFQREANIVSRLHHPNIATVIGAGLEDRTFCIAMELICGQTVEAMMVELWRRGETIPPAMSIAIAVAILDAAAYAHALTDQDGEPLNIVHRDLSPRNVMLSYDGEIKVIDFGVAHGRIDGFKTAPGMMVGTLRYMSPEQATAHPVDARSDLYAIGVVLYELLAGQPVITETKAVDVLNRVISDPVPRLSTSAPNLPIELDAVIAKATEKKKSDRYQSAEEMRAALLAACVSLDQCTHREVGEYAVAMFPEHADETRAWYDEAAAYAEAADSLDHDTLSEARPVSFAKHIPTIRAPSVARAARDARAAEETLDEIDPPTIPPRDDTPRPTVITPRPASIARPNVRLARLESQIRRWRWATVILLVALSSTIATLAWVLANNPSTR